MENVILVDEHDRVLGLMEKLEAHQKGVLHRAISVFVFNSQGELLLQQRAPHKYHSPLLWTNTCCSHPRNDETTLESAQRRLKEEMGMTCPLSHLFHFIYRAEFDNGLIEHELDHVFLGISDELPKPNVEEAADFKYLKLDLLLTDLKANPQDYTPWFEIILSKHLDKIEKAICA